MTDDWRKHAKTSAAISTDVRTWEQELENCVHKDLPEVQCCKDELARVSSQKWLPLVLAEAEIAKQKDKDDDELSALITKRKERDVRLAQQLKASDDAAWRLLYSLTVGKDYYFQGHKVPMEVYKIIEAEVNRILDANKQVLVELENKKGEEK